MKRPATLWEARVVVQKAKRAWDLGDRDCHKWIGEQSLWLDGGNPSAIPHGESITIVGTRLYAATLFNDPTVTRWINDRSDDFEDMHSIWAQMLDYERVSRNGHLVWQAKLANPKRGRLK